MCVMEVRPGQRTSTMLQAMGHNTNTVVGDCDLLLEVLKARPHSWAQAQHVRALRNHLSTVYQSWLRLYGEEVARMIEHQETDHDEHDHGSERQPAVDPLPSDDDNVEDSWLEAVAQSLKRPLEPAEREHLVRTVASLVRTDERRARRYETR